MLWQRLLFVRDTLCAYKVDIDSETYVLIIEMCPLVRAAK